MSGRVELQGPYARFGCHSIFPQVARRPARALIPAPHDGSVPVLIGLGIAAWLSLIMLGTLLVN